MTKSTQTHELLVEGDKVLERTDSGTILAEKDYEHVLRGYMAAEHNPRFSEETRKNAERLRRDLEAAHEGQIQAPQAVRGHAKPQEQTGESHAAEVHRHHVIAGLKANIHRDDRSEESKEASRQKLREMGEDVE